MDANALIEQLRADVGAKMTPAAAITHLKATATDLSQFQCIFLLHRAFPNAPLRVCINAAALSGLGKDEVLDERRVNDELGQWIS